MRWAPWSTGAGAFAWHHGWSPSILVQVSNILSLNTKGNVQLSQPVDEGYIGGAVVGDHIARNPVYCSLSLEENLMVIEFVSVMMLQGLVVCPQCLDL